MVFVLLLNLSISSISSSSFAVEEKKRKGEGMMKMRDGEREKPCLILDETHAAAASKIDVCVPANSSWRGCCDDGMGWERVDWWDRESVVVYGFVFTIL